MANPVGGIREQIHDGVTGLLSEAPEAHFLAAAIRTLMENPSLYLALRSNIDKLREDRSMSMFVRRLVMHALQ